MAKRNVLDRKMFAQKGVYGTNNRDYRLDVNDGIVLPDGTILMPEIVISSDEDLPEREGYGQDGTSTSDYLGFDRNQRRIIDRSVPQRGDYGTFRGLSPTFTRESSDYTQGDDRQVDDPEIIKRNIEKTMIPQGGNVTPQGGFPNMEAGRVQPDVSQSSGNVGTFQGPGMSPDFGLGRVQPDVSQSSGDVGTFQGMSPDFGQGRVPSVIPQGGDVGTFQGMSPDFNQGRVPKTQGGIETVITNPSRQGRVATPAVPVAVPDPNITSKSIRASGIAGVAGVAGDGTLGSTGDGTPYMLEDINIVDKGSPPPPPPQSGPSIIGQIAPAAALTALGASFAKNVGGSDEDPVKELREIAESLRGSTMPLNMPVFRSEGSPPFGEGLADSSQRFFGGKFPTFSDMLPERDNPLILKSDKLDSSRENMFRLLYEKLNEKFFGTTPKEVPVGQQTGDPQTVGVQGPINLAQKSSGLKTDVGDISDDSQKSDKEPDPESSDQEKDDMAAILALLQGDTTKKTPKDFKTRVKERTTLYKDILGMDDNERKMNAYLVLAQAAANVAKSAGKNRKVLDVLSEGLQTLPLGLAKARAAERKEDLAIGTAAISAEEAIDSAVAKSQADFVKTINTELIKSKFNPSKEKQIQTVLQDFIKTGDLSLETISKMESLGLLQKYPKTAEILSPLTNQFVRMSPQAKPTKAFLKSIPERNSNSYDMDGTAIFVAEGQPELGEEHRDELFKSLREDQKILNILNDAVNKASSNLTDAYGPGAAFSRMSSSLFVPFLGDVDIPGIRATRLLDVTDIQKVKNALKRSFYNDRPGGGRLLKAEYEDLEKELQNFNAGIFSDKTVMLRNLNKFRRKLVNSMLTTHSRLTGVVLPLLKQIPSGTETDPLLVSDVANNPFIRDVLRNAPSKVFIQSEDPNGNFVTRSYSSSQALSLIPYEGQ